MKRLESGARARCGRRAVVIGAVAIAPTFAMAWTGCTSDDSASAGAVHVDPGGTFGAEVLVTVVGRGRVIGAIPGTSVNGIDCPSNCYVRYTFENAAAPNASAGIALRAISTPGVRFKGYTFQTDPLATKGRGGESCNPITRPAGAPPGDPASAEINLPFGETAGTPPAGQEACDTTVPLAYKIVATFEDEPVVIPDGGDGGDGGSPGEILYEAPVAGATGGELGLAGGRLYWRYKSGSFDGIASGSVSATLGSSPTITLSPSSTLQQFDVGTSYIVYQKSTGALSYISAGSTFASTLSGGPATCQGVTSDSSNIFCRNGSTLYSWTSGGSGPYTQFTGVPASSDRFAVDSTYLYFVNDPSGTAGTATIQRVLRSGGGDAEVASPTTIFSAETKPIRLMLRSSYLFWINYDGTNDLGEQRSGYYSGTTAYTGVAATNGMRFLSPDTSSSSAAVVATVNPGATDCKVYRVTGGSTSSQLLVGGIPNLTGVVADSSYVYWTQNDGRVWRKSKF